MGYLCLAIGTALTLVAGGVIPTDPSQFFAPRWMLALAGLSVIACGGSLITPKDSVPQLCCIGFILVSFAMMGGWVAVFSSDDSIAGGIPFIPRSVNIFLGRCLFGLGPIVCLGMLWSLVSGSLKQQQ
ncbi:hypothetical protein C1752_04076 [Acaryochloris thomasi RCC1774]|uniref:Uncharacterized protein n=2 Tax=Acaryochloris TaxID=155977 RepID=A0A2W1JEB6_9CYAN|nr:hypothetical protein C1752_04076 [Acaryochloris thomasi RCC1774]